MSDLANFQEFFISQGWGEERSVRGSCQTISKISRNSSFLGGGGEQGSVSATSSFLRHGGDLCKVGARHVFNYGDISSLEH